MSKRQYDGSPIDITWNNGPWANDGETVDATNNEDGNMITIEWPDNATDPEELNEDQRNVIRIAARNPDIDNYNKIQKMADVDKNESYAAWVLREHWPERHVRKGYGTLALSNREVDKTRIALNNGETVSWLSDHFDVTKQTVRRAAKGSQAYNSVDCKTPPLKNKSGDWSIKHTSDENDSSEQGVSKPYPTATVDAWRKRALNGDTATEIADEYEGVWPADISMALRGDSNVDGQATQPELEWDNSNQEWLKKESEGDATNEQTEIDETEEETTTDAVDTEDTTDTTIPGESSTYHPPERDTNTKRLAIGVAIVALVSYVLGKLRGGQ
jgi:hypothetical protein